MASTTPPDKDRELRLVNNVEMKIALASTDAQLQKLLNLYLPPLLLKLMSPHEAVRNKVVQVCNHISTRIAQPSIQLPVKALLEQSADTAAGGQSSLLRSFDLVYINAGLPRISDAERRELLPVIIRGRISTIQNEGHQRSMFNILLQLLPHFDIPERGSKDDDALRSVFSFDENKGEALWLARWFQKLMLLSLPNVMEGKGPGLSKEDVEFLSVGGKKEIFSGQMTLPKARAAVMKFVTSGAFDDRERLSVALPATSEAETAIAGPAQDVMKRSLGAVSLDDEDVVEELYGLLLGKAKTPPVKETLQARILPLLSKSRTAVSMKYKAHIRKIVDIGLSSSYSKLQQSVFQFITWTARMADYTLTEAVGPEVVEKVRYWIVGDNNAHDELLGYAYDILALMTSRCNELLLDPGIDVIRFLFDRQVNEKGSAVRSVESALGIVLVALVKAKLPADVQSHLEELILETVSADNRATGQAVRWAGRLLSFDSIIGRWVGVLAAEMGGAIAEEGEKALHPYYYRLINPDAAVPEVVDVFDDDGMEIEEEPKKDKFAFPQFAPLLNYLFSPLRKLPPSFNGPFFGVSRLPQKSFSAALLLLKSIAIWESLPSDIRDNIKIDEDWVHNTDATIADESTRPAIETFFANPAQADAVQTLLEEAWTGMTTGNEGLDSVRNFWADLAALVPQNLLQSFVGRVGDLQKLLNASKTEARRVAAEAIGIIGSHPALDSSARKNLLEFIVNGTEKCEVGAVAAAGFVLSRSKMRGLLNNGNLETITRTGKSLTYIITNSRDAQLLDITIDALGELLAFAVFPDGSVDVTDLRKPLLDRAKRSDEKAVLTLAYTTFLAPSTESDKSVTDNIIKVGEAAGVEMAFVVGEALAAIAAGWGSKAVRQKRTLAGVEWNGFKKSGAGDMIDLLVKRAGESGGGGKRRITVVGLWSMLELCGDIEDVKNRLPEIQERLRGFLSDRDDFIQETASRGLTAVYNLSDDEKKKELVRSLVSSFTGEKTAKMQNISRDTQLFEPGQLPTGEKDVKLSSYGDIVSLASEMGDPSLVYKFMALARHNSVWSSRAAFGRFGLGTLLSGSDEIKNNAKLWPTLYRYRFDPSQGVRQSMDSIWSALGGGSDTVERWWKEILNECLKSALNGKEWRVREASTAALADLLSGRKVSAYKDRLEDIWKVDFMVLDDIKESVRIAAMKLAKVLTNAMVRAVEGEMPKKEKEDILGSLMEFLMGSKGIEAESKDVQMFALNTILQVIKTGGHTLRPWIPDLVDKLVMVMSDLEPEAVNYLIMNADKYKTTSEEIDRLRLNSLRASPLMSAVESLLDSIDEPTLALFIPRLTKSIRTSLGLPSKVACSRVVVALSMKHPVLFKRHADETLKYLLPAIKDRSEIVSKSYAVAIGYLCRIASDVSIISAAKTWVQEQYWNGEERERRAAGAVVAAIWKHATDRASALASSTLPFVFIAKFDRNKEVREEFVHTWGENTGGSGAVKLYLKEIVELAMKGLGSQRWDAKQTCAVALAEAAGGIAASGDVTAGQIDTLYPALVAAANGKSWVGKEKVIDGFVKFLISSKSLISDTRRFEVTKILLREAKRQNLSYRAPAMRSLGEFLIAYQTVDLFSPVQDLIDEVLTTEEDPDAMEVDGEVGGKQLSELLTKNAFFLLMAAFRPSAPQCLTIILEYLNKHIPLPNSPPAVKVASVTDLTALLGRLDKGFLGKEVMGETWRRLAEHLEDRNSEASRIAAAKGVKEVVSLGGVEQLGGLKKRVAGLVREERAVGVRNVLEEVLGELNE